MVRVVKKPEERKREIIEAAAKLFNSKGYDNTTMKNVMDEVGIAKGTIYHYFKSKEELLEAVIIHMAGQEQERLKELVNTSSGSAIDKIKTLAMSNSAEHHDPQLFKELHKPGNAGMHTRLLALLITNQAELYGELIKQGCEEGLFSTDHPLECAEYMLSAISFLTDMGIYPWSDKQLSRRIHALPGLVEATLKAPKDSFQFLLNLQYTLE